MANGVLGKNDLSASTNTSVYTVPGGTYAVASVNICNRGSNTANIRIAIGASGTPSNSEYIEYDVALAPNGVLERTGLVIGENQILICRSSEESVSAVAYGIETTLPA